MDSMNNNQVTGISTTLSENSQMSVGTLTLNYNQNCPTPHIEAGRYHFSKCREELVGGIQNEIFKYLDNLYFKQGKRLVALLGLPGIGKSKHANYFATICQKKRKFYKVYNMDATTTEILEKSFENLATELLGNDINKIDIRCLIDNVYEHLENDKCLLIFDNAQDLNKLTEYLPSKSKQNFYFLITSCIKDWGDEMISITLNPLESKSAVEFFQIYLKDHYKEEDRDFYKDLANGFGNIPSELLICVKYVRKLKECLPTNIVPDAKKVIRLVKEDIEAKLEDVHSTSLFYKIIILLENFDTSKLHLLYVCGFLHPDKIYYSKIFFKMPHIKKLFKDNIIRLRLALGIIANNSLIYYNPDEDKIKISSFIQEILRFHVKRDGLEEIIYYTCLQFVFETDDDFGNRKTILTYADNNVSILYEYYKDSKRLHENILISLVKFECIECLKKIFKDSCSHKYVREYNLLKYAVDTNIINLLKNYEGCILS